MVVRAFYLHLTSNEDVRQESAREKDREGKGSEGRGSGLALAPTCQAVEKSFWGPEMGQALLPLPGLRAAHVFQTRATVVSSLGWEWTYCPPETRRQSLLLWEDFLLPRPSWVSHPKVLYAVCIDKLAGDRKEALGVRSVFRDLTGSHVALPREDALSREIGLSYLSCVWTLAIPCFL